MGKLTSSQKALILETYKKWRVWSNVKKIIFWKMGGLGGHDLVQTRNDGRKSNLRVRGCTIHWLDFDLITFPPLLVSAPTKLIEGGFVNFGGVIKEKSWFFTFSDVIIVHDHLLHLMKTVQCLPKNYYY